MISSLSIVVPAYNEEADLASTVLGAEAALHEHVTGGLEWILVDDGSSDGTWSEMKRLAASMPAAILVQHSINRGLGSAIWTGTAQATLEWCSWIPADGQLDPSTYVDMVGLADGADLVLLMRDETERGQWRRILTLAFYGWMRALFGFHPYGFSGVYLARRSLLQEVPLRGTTAVQNYAVAIHFRKNGRRIRQARTVVLPRISGRSKVANPRTVLKVLNEMVRLRFQL